MNKLFLSDGTTLDLPEHRLQKFLVMLTHRGIKSVRFGLDIVVISPSNLIRIELGEENERDSKRSKRKRNKRVAVPEVVERSEDGEGDATDSREDEPVAEEKKESPQERTDRVLAEMKEKSDCAGNGHKGKEQVIHFQDVMIRRKGAKTSLPSRRYFPVCAFCGLRQKYVKAESLSDEQKDNATLYEVK